MARGAGGGIPGNDLGQGSTSPSTFTHVLGVSGAPTGAVGGAADGRGSMWKTSFGTALSVPHGHAVFCGGRTQHHPLSAISEKSRMGNASLVHTRRVPHVPTAVGGTADGTDRSTGDTQNMGESAGTGGTLA